jgi:hypothetical protein
MSITLGDNLKHNNPIFPIVDIEDVKGGIRTIANFSNTDLYNAFNDIPDKLKQNYSNLIVTSTNEHYYLSGTDATITTSWTLTGSGLSASGTTNSITKWTGSTSLGDSLITDNGDTVTINGNLNVIGTSSTITSENLLVKDPIILLAGSQSTPLFDSGLFVNRGTGDTQAFIWDESSSEFSFFSTTSSATTSGNVLIGTYSNVRTGPLSVGTGITSSSRFSVSSTGGTLSLVVNEQGDTIFSGDTKISGQTFSNLPPGSITFGNKTSIYSPGDRQIVIGTDNLSGYNYNYGWKFTDYQITNLWGNPIEVQNTMGTIGNLWIGSNLNFAGYGVIPSQKSTLFVKGTTSSIMKVVGTGATWSNSQSIFEINNNGAVSIGTTAGSASLHITGTSSVSGNSLLVENSSNTQLLKVLNNGQIILGDSNSAAAPASSVQGVFIIGQGNANYGPNSSNPNLLTFIVGSTDASFISGIQGASVNYGNVRSGIYFTNNASDIVFRAGYFDEYGTQTAQLQQRMRIGVSGNVNINSATAMSGSKLFIQSNTASTTIGSNVMLDLYNGQITAVPNQVSELAFSADTAAGVNSYNTQHRYAIISGYATTWNGIVTGGGIKFSTRSTTVSSLVTSLVLDQNGGVYNQSRGISNTIYGFEALITSTASVNNTAFGYQALYASTVNESVAFGYQSLRFNTTGIFNTGLGNYSLYNNTTGGKNIAVGLTTLYRNKTGYDNIAIGHQSMYHNTTGYYNTAVGSSALLNSTSVVSSLNIVNGGSGYTASSTFSSVQLSYISGTTALTYPTITVYVGSGGTVSTVTLETFGTGFSDTTTVMGANLGTGFTFSVSIGSLTSGNNNTAIGYQSMYSNTSGYQNTSIGSNSLFSNSRGYQNTSIGSSTLQINTTGFQNTAVGYQSMYSNTTGYGNTSLGYQSLWLNSTGNANIAIGYQSLWLNTIGEQNISIGEATMASNKSGNYNVSIGNSILNSATASLSNTVVGSSALQNLLVGNYNIVIGRNSAYNSTTLIGLTQSSNSVYIGAEIKPIENQTNQIIIGHGATGSGSNSVTLGADTITKTQLRGTINIGNVPQYASNGAAISGGLVPGDIYQTLSNVLMVVV